MYGEQEEHEYHIPDLALKEIKQALGELSPDDLMIYAVAVSVSLNAMGRMFGGLPVIFMSDETLGEDTERASEINKRVYDRVKTLVSQRN